MHYTRLDLRFLPRGWSGGQLVEGIVAGAVRGIVVEVDSRQIEYTLIQPRHVPRGSDMETHLAGTSRTVLPDGLVRLSRQTLVHAGSSTVGWVSEVWCDRQSRTMTHVLVTSRRRLLSRTTRVVDVAHISSMNGTELTLKLSAAEAGRLPIYRTDAAILSSVAESFEAALPDPRTRRSVKVRVEDGHVFLGGLVDTPEVKRLAETVASNAPGIRGITSDIVIAESLAVDVEAGIERALASLKSTGARVRTFTEHGIVYLEGVVPDAETRNALERVAVGVPGVRVVVNNLLAPGEAPSRARDTGPLTRNK